MSDWLHKIHIQQINIVITWWQKKKIRCLRGDSLRVLTRRFSLEKMKYLYTGAGPSIMKLYIELSSFCRRRVRQTLSTICIFSHFQNESFKTPGCQTKVPKQLRLNEFSLNSPSLNIYLIKTLSTCHFHSFSLRIRAPGCTVNHAIAPTRNRVDIFRLITFCNRPYGTNPKSESTLRSGVKVVKTFKWGTHKFTVIKIKIAVSTLKSRRVLQPPRSNLPV